MFSASLLVSIFVLLFVLVTIAKSVRIVPQGEEWIVERLGKYLNTLKPGLNIVVPYMDKVQYKLSTKDIILEVQQQEIITKDNAIIVANALCFIKVVDPRKAAYGVQDYQFAVATLTMTSLRAIIGSMELDDALSSRETIKAHLAVVMSNQTDDWGIVVRSVEIQDIKPSESMQVAMERQAAAERERKAVVTKAEGARQAAVLEATAREEAATKDALATIKMAEASAISIAKVKEAIGDNVVPAMYLLGERYIQALQNLSSSPNAKLVILPADLQESVRGLLGKTPT